MRERATWHGEPAPGGGASFASLAIPLPLLEDPAAVADTPGHGA